MSVRLQQGSMLHGNKYRIEKTLGQGGFGITYLATNISINKMVAIKEFFMQGCERDPNMNLIPNPSKREEFEAYKAKFQDEAKMLASFKHNHIVDVFDYFEENNTFYMLMSYVEGETLQRKVRGRGGPLSESATRKYLLQLTDALGYIHAEKVLHRDVSPDNVIINKEDEAVLIDFGAAREFASENSKKMTTILRPNFAPPEQWKERSRQGPQLDVYALGATIYYCLTGQLPMVSVERKDEKWEPLTGTQLDKLLQKAMQLEPTDRYPNMSAFKEAVEKLEETIHDGTIPYRDGGIGAPTPRGRVEHVNPNGGRVGDNLREPETSKMKYTGSLLLVTFLTVMLAAGYILFFSEEYSASENPSHEKVVEQQPIEKPTDTSQETGESSPNAEAATGTTSSVKGQAEQESAQKPVNSSQATADPPPPVTRPKQVPPAVYSKPDDFKGMLTSLSDPSIPSEVRESWIPDAERYFESSYALVNFTSGNSIYDKKEAREFLEWLIEQNPRVLEKEREENEGKISTLTVEVNLN